MGSAEPGQLCTGVFKEGTQHLHYDNLGINNFVRDYLRSKGRTESLLPRAIPNTS